MWISHVKTGDYTSMNPYKSFKELKQLARESLLGNYGTLIGATLILSVFSGIFSVVVNFVVNPLTQLGLIIFILIQIIFSLILGVVSIGFNKMYLSIARNQPISISQLFFGFQNHPDRAILIQGIFILFLALCIVPYGIFTFLFYVRPSIELGYFSAAFLSLFIGLFIYYIITLRFSLCFYLLIDEPELTTLELLKKSTSMMKGQKKRYFLLSLSFISWALLSLISFGIAALWAGPYIDMTFAHFYMELREQMNSSTVHDMHSYYI
ncbi:DUF975 family protein [bacterium 1XD42-8]|nr:DUF975 family protein [bacterium 1XD42-8]